MAFFKRLYARMTYWFSYHSAINAPHIHRNAYNDLCYAKQPILGDIRYAYMQTICIQHGKSLSISDRFAGIDRRCNINLQKRYTKKRVFIQTLRVTGF